MNLTLKIDTNEKKGVSASLVKQMCTLECRINVDLASSIISVTGIDDDKVGDVIAAVGETFEIIGVDIIPTEEVAAVSTEKTEVIQETSKMEINEESFEVQKVEFGDPYVENWLEKLSKKIAWVVYSKNVSTTDVCKFIMSAMNEIEMRYGPEIMKDFSIGDVVDCNFGVHSKGEVSGGHVHALVCDITSESAVYLVPIAKTVNDFDSAKHIAFVANEDVDYFESRFKGGVLLLKKGVYLNQGRIINVIGHASPELLEKVIKQLPSAFDFSNNSQNYEEKFNERFGSTENDEDTFPSAEDDDEEQVTANEETQDVEVVDEPKLKAETAKKIPASEYLLNRFSDAFNSLAYYENNSINEKIAYFLKEINFTYKGQAKKEYKLVSSAFLEVYTDRTIKYSDVVNKIYKRGNFTSESKVREILTSNFKKWLDNYPDINEEYPRISFKSLLNAFSEFMNNSK